MENSPFDDSEDVKGSSDRIPINPLQHSKSHDEKDGDSELCKSPQQIPSVQLSLPNDKFEEEPSKNALNPPNLQLNDDNVLEINSSSPTKETAKNSLFDTSNLISLLDTNSNPVEENILLQQSQDSGVSLDQLTVTKSSDSHQPTHILDASFSTLFGTVDESLLNTNFSARDIDSQHQINSMNEVGKLVDISMVTEMANEKCTLNVDSYNFHDTSCNSKKMFVSFTDSSALLEGGLLPTTDETIAEEYYSILSTAESPESANEFFDSDNFEQPVNHPLLTDDSFCNPTVVMNESEDSKTKEIGLVVSLGDIEVLAKSNVNLPKVIDSPKLEIAQKKVASDEGIPPDSIELIDPDSDQRDSSNIKQTAAVLVYSLCDMGIKTANSVSVCDENLNPTDVISSSCELASVDLEIMPLIEAPDSDSCSDSTITAPTEIPPEIENDEFQQENLECISCDAKISDVDTSVHSVSQSGVHELVMLGCLNMKSVDTLVDSLANTTFDEICDKINKLHLDDSTDNFPSSQQEVFNLSAMLDDSKKNENFAKNSDINSTQAEVLNPVASCPLPNIVAIQGDSTEHRLLTGESSKSCESLNICDSLEDIPLTPVIELPVTRVDKVHLVSLEKHDASEDVQVLNEELEDIFHVMHSAETEEFDGTVPDTNVAASDFASGFVDFFKNKYGLPDSAENTANISEELLAECNKPSGSAIAETEQSDENKPFYLNDPVSAGEENFVVDSASSNISSDNAQIARMFSDNTLTNVLKDDEGQPLLISSEKEWVDKIAAAKLELQIWGSLKDKSVELSESIQKCLAEGYKCIYDNIEGKEKEFAAMASHQKAIKKERDQSVEDVANVEKAFTELILRYEKAKSVLEQMKENELVLKEILGNLNSEVTEQEQKCQMLHKKAEENINRANEELTKIHKEKEAEKTALSAMTRRAEIKCKSLAITLDQLEKENKELSNMCADYGYSK